MYIYVQWMGTSRAMIRIEEEHVSSHGSVDAGSESFYSTVFGMYTTHHWGSSKKYLSRRVVAEMSTVECLAR